jgi:hypothetical protein
MILRPVGYRVVPDFLKPIWVVEAVGLRGPRLLWKFENALMSWVFFDVRVWLLDAPSPP